MTQMRRGRGERPAFTLIELLVVIAIIAVLIGLTGAAVMRAMVKGPEIQTRSDIGEIESLLGSVKSRDYNGCPILPSHLRLREDNNYISSTPAIQADYNQTKAFLQQAFGRHVCYDFAYPLSSNAAAAASGTTFIDWNGNGTADAGDLVLEGEQCLVFWLGGVPKYSGTNMAMTGFSTSNKANPAAAGGSRTTPFEFQPARLKSMTGQGGTASFPCYLDGWSKSAPTPQPYAFFASYKTEGNGSYQTTDCSSLGAAPYTDPTGKWVNAGSFQIISAGRDGKFGAGGTWSATAGTADPNGKDDQANFAPRTLAGGAN